MARALQPLAARHDRITALGLLARARARQTGDRIVRAAEERACDPIVTGTHGKNKIRRALMGSVAEQVMRQASCPVVIVRQPTAAR